MEGDRFSHSSAEIVNIFQSTPSAWRETTLDSFSNHLSEFQSTPSAWRETRRRNHQQLRRSISIHSLRMEGDLTIMYFVSKMEISIHSLRMEGDLIITGRASTIPIFQSTPSAWRETNTIVITRQEDILFQSTPSAWRETLKLISFQHSGYHFNPLPPHGGRRKRRWRELLVVIFQSTPSAWRETLCFSTFFAGFYNFNPLPPHGGRPRFRQSIPTDQALFQSTPSAWRETIQMFFWKAL